MRIDNTRDLVTLSNKLISLIKYYPTKCHEILSMNGLFT